MELFERNLRSAEGGQWFTPDRFEEFYNTAIDTVKTVKQRGRKGKESPEAINIPASFDTEFTSFQRVVGKDEIEDCGIMYVWGFGVNGAVMIGRTYEELIDFMDKLAKRLELGAKRNLIVYVHNLGADFQYIRKWFEWVDVFSLDERKPLYARTSGGYCFRCSYLLTNVGLEKLGTDLRKYKVEKLSETVDYSLIRHQKTPLTSTEIQYLVNDCLVVMSHVQECIEDEGSILKIPLTSTGYVRRYCRNACLYPNGTVDKEHWKYRSIIEKLTLQPEEYIQLKRAFAGGFTHANSWYVGQLLENVEAFDLSSDYPSVIVSEVFPMSKGKKIDVREIKDRADLDRLMELYCCVFTVKFEGLQSVVEYDHYISKSKALDIVNAVVDNGRVVDADSLTITITEVDFGVIDKCYKWDSMELSSFWVYRRGYLPTPFVRTVLELYEKKTALKGVAGKEEDYNHAKGLLNSLYGMMVTDIARDVILYNEEWGHESPEYGDVISQYNNSQGRFLSYAWGVYVTAYARKHLWMVILESGDDHVYSDTDNDKMLNADQHRPYLELWNQWLLKKLELAMKHHGLPLEMVKPKTIKGVEKLLGAWEPDGCYRYFKTLGAKRYMTQEDDVISITVAGVNKGQAVPYLLERHNIPFVKDEKKPFVYHITDPTADTRPVFDDFNEGLVLPGEYRAKKGDIRSASGKLTHKYIDCERSGKVRDYLGNVADFYERSAMVLIPASYSMGLSEEFKNFLNGVKTYKK